MDEFLDSASGRAEVAASVGVLVVFVLFQLKLTCTLVRLLCGVNSKRVNSCLNKMTSVNISNRIVLLKKLQ